MKQKLEKVVLAACGNPTPEQALALGKVLLIMGIALAAKMILVRFPSLWATSINVIIFVLMILLLIRYLRLTTHRWFIKALPALFIGGMLNYTVLFANNGYMPSVLRTPESASGIYIPLDGASLPYLSDWIWRGMSPGDLIMFAGLLTVPVIHIIRQRQITNRQYAIVEQP